MSTLEPRPSHEQIEKRAYELYLARGGEHGNGLQDWFMAERVLTPDRAVPQEAEAKPRKKSASHAVQA
jgi:hypothetical protein